VLAAVRAEKLHTELINWADDNMLLLVSRDTSARATAQVQTNAPRVATPVRTALIR
jgi:hypothetical protein